ncbi:hypothetical protein BJ138DRAFT_1019498 [Hygrophoropsis aurantiaca]|uniref:Uncharacterized protein n=1 Tax=Hygrophoropsis aurantiaca TaxID=72124 RepID=A0ACB7ZSK5_9AGAM|nr:hypothetical protein BJ138DRAFT_1019498 [Hygrophoropsis aurantiaca]
MLINSAEALDNRLSATNPRRNSTRVPFLYVRMDSFPSISKFRTLLRRLEGVAVMELNLPLASNARWQRLLSGIQLDDLETLSTTAPHTELAAFLRRHPSITHLQIEGCASPDCSLNDTPLPALTEVSGPTSCLAALINQNPIAKICASQEDVQVPPPLPRLLYSLSTSTATLTILHLDFDPNERDILRQIAAIAPLLTALKLCEKSLSLTTRGTGVRLRRAWNYSTEWRDHLMLLGHLSRFLLKTTAPLVRTLGSKREEAIMVSNWTRGVVRRGGVREHPALEHLTLWYRSEVDGGVLCFWDKVGKGRSWVRASRLFSPGSEAFV